MKQASKYLKQIDLFSSPFAFELDNDQKQKKTQAGGLFSCLVYCFLIIYFTYLCYLYFTSQINPSISQNTILYDKNYTTNLTNDLLAFQLYLPDGQSLPELEQATGLVYLNVLPIYKYLDENGISQQKMLSFVNCNDPLLTKYICIDFSSAGLSQSELIMPFDPDKVGSYSINLLFIVCDPKYLQENQQCATYEQIRQQVLKLGTQGVMRMTTSQFNPKTKQYEKSIKQEVFGFSEDLTLNGQIILQQSTTKITEGFLLQNDSETNHLSDYQRQDQYVSNKFIQEELQMNLIAFIKIYIGRNGITKQIQFPPFTQILAQFSSVVNIVLISGIFISAYSKKAIIEDLIDIQLRNYFKKTSFNLIQKQKENQQDKQSLSQRLVHAYKSIQKAQIAQNFQKYFQVSLFQRLKVFFVDNQVKKNDSNQLIRYKQIYQEAEKYISIFEIQKQLLQVKMMLRILFSAEQFAAIQLCGNDILSSEQYQKLNNITQTNKQDLDKHGNQNKYEKYQIEFENKQKEKNQTLRIPESYSPNQNLILDSNTADINNYNLDTQKIDIIKEQELHLSKQVADSRSNTVNQEINSGTNNSQNKIINSQNHLEKINLIESNLDYFQIYLERFLDKNYVKSDLDYRILNCMINVDKEDDIEIK
ncbi:hypothetical protein ABPG74_009619 [Tetrahymena malaccensis]